MSTITGSERDIHFEPSGQSLNNLFPLAWSDWEYFYSPLDGMLVRHRITPAVKFAGTQEQNAVPWPRAQTWTAQVQCINHEASGPSTKYIVGLQIVIYWPCFSFHITFVLGGTLALYSLHRIVGLLQPAAIDQGVLVCPGNDTKPHPVLRLQAGKTGVLGRVEWPLNYHHSQVHTYLEW